MNAVVIRNGRVIDPANGIDGVFDLRVVDGRIAAIEAPGSAATVRPTGIIEASGCWVMPGLIDVHVHLRDPGFPRKETIASGLRAAAAGGFTAVAAMANTSPVNDTPEVIRYMIERAREAGAARLIPVSAVSRGLAGQELVDMPAMAEAGARLFSDDGMPIDDTRLLAEALECSKALKVSISLHEEDRRLAGEWAMNAGEVAARLGLPGVSSAAETVRVQRDLEIARALDAPVHVAHVSAPGSAAAIDAARRAGLHVTCEIAPHHFSIDESAVLRFGANAKVNPPLRSRADVERLRQAIADRMIDMIASDHAPHDPDSKAADELAAAFGSEAPHELSASERMAFCRAANGLVGLETALGLSLNLVHRGTISPGRLVEMMSLNPARLLGIGGGTLTRGAVADVTVVDPEFEWNVAPDRFLTRSKNTPFQEVKLKGKAMLTMVSGKIAYDGRHFMDN